MSFKISNTEQHSRTSIATKVELSELETDIRKSMENSSKEIEMSFHISSNVRTHEGSLINTANPAWGSKNTFLLRRVPADYDNILTTAKRGTNHPNPRSISNLICKGSPVLSSRNLSDITWVWGQFVDHEINLTSTQTGGETLPISTPVGDLNELFPSHTIPFSRSLFSLDQTGVRQHKNEISSYIDATNVYGPLTNRCSALRTFVDGKLKTSLSTNGEVILPYNTEGIDNAPDTSSSFFIAGDVRANENIFLTALHTLFVREHNRICEYIKSEGVTKNDEIIFQKARRMVIALQQNITFSEFLPSLLGPVSTASSPHPLNTYGGFNSDTNAGIHTEFSTVGYRFGHTMVSSVLQTGPSQTDTILLRDAFFTPSFIATNGINNLLLGMTTKKANEVDNIIVDDLRNFLFGPPSGGMLHDLASLNIQRGRDHGIPGYNDVREAYQLPRIPDFNSLEMPAQIRTDLASLYTTVDDIDPWVGCICENHLPDSSAGALLTAIIKHQFFTLREGDRLWFEVDPVLSAKEIAEIKQTTLADVISRNTPATLSGNIFITSS
jgi:hypothetical protein